MAVDFVKSDGSKNQPKQSGYDIEYTNPTGENATAAKPKHGNLLGFFQKAKPNPYSQPAGSIRELPQQPKAVSATVPTAQVKPKQSYQPVSQPTPAPVRAIHELPQQSRPHNQPPQPQQPRSQQPQQPRPQPVQQPRPQSQQPRPQPAQQQQRPPQQPAQQTKPSAPDQNKVSWGDLLQ
ncbi:MAG TPA: hypothetical protein DEG44_05720 [Candidatus Kerfeldbacteria bacterium]|nr:hypothetical protein [Candidatus Kerfeldbacteria bacterium]